MIQNNNTLHNLKAALFIFGSKCIKCDNTVSIQTHDVHQL